MQPRLEVDAERHSHRPGVQRIAVLADIQHDQFPAPLLRSQIDRFREDRDGSQRLGFRQDAVRHVFDHQPQPGESLAQRQIDRHAVRRLRQGVRTRQGRRHPANAFQALESRTGRVNHPPEMVAAPRDRVQRLHAHLRKHPFEGVQDRLLQREAPSIVQERLRVKIEVHVLDVHVGKEPFPIPQRAGHIPLAAQKEVELRRPLHGKARPDRVETAADVVAGGILKTRTAKRFDHPGADIRGRVVLSDLHRIRTIQDVRLRGGR